MYETIVTFPFISVTTHDFAFDSKELLGRLDSIYEVPCDVWCWCNDTDQAVYQEIPERPGLYWTWKGNKEMHTPQDTKLPKYVYMLKGTDTKRAPILKLFGIIWANFIFI